MVTHIPNTDLVRGVDIGIGRYSVIINELNNTAGLFNLVIQKEDR